jgi:AraC-like DNA-binding protein
MPHLPLEKPVLSGFHGRVRCEPGWHLDAAWSNRLTDYDLWLVWAGQGKMKVGRRTLTLHPGTCVWMRPGTRYTAQQDPADRLGVSFTHFTLPTAPPGFRPPFETTRVRSLDFAAATLAEVVRLRSAEPHLAAPLFAVLLQILAADQRRTTGAPTPTLADQRQAIQALTTRIAAEPGRPWTVAAMAREHSYAVDHFSKVFAHLTGLRPQAYVVRARLDRARQLLTETTLNITEIAAALGFTDVYFFSRQFHAKTGQTPSAYRRQRLTGAVPASHVKTSA